MSKVSQIPYGTQYYYAPAPARKDWARDLRNIKKSWFNTVKIFSCWSWNHPSAGKYLFDDVDEVMNLAQKNGLWVVLNVIVDAAPAWLYQKYPDCRMQTSDGRKLGPLAYSCRPGGGAPGPCLNHPQAIKLLLDFLAEVAGRYAKHPALYAWDVWNEPELTGALMRDVGWGKAGETRDLVCYCKNCITEFKNWLQEKYRTIEKLNRAWNKNYQGWNEVEIPISPQVFQDMIDWRLFFVETMANHLKLRVETVKKYDQKHPVMCHAVTMPYFNQISCGSDEWKLAKECDEFGYSAPASNPFIADFCLSAAKGKRVWGAELHIGGATLIRYQLNFDDLKRFIFGALGRGIKGFLYWTYRPERTGTQAPGFGLTSLDGSSSPLLESASRIGKVLKDNAEFLSSCQPARTDIAILFQPESQIFSWCAASTVNLHDKSMMGVYQALYDHNYNVDFIHPSEIENGILSNYKVIYLPFPYYLRESVCSHLQDWVEKGGTLISEPFLAGFDTETGWHREVMPGYGFDKVFQVKEDTVLTYDLKTTVPLLVKEKLALLAKGGKAVGVHTRQSFISTGAKTICTFQDGKPAVTLARYGKGRAVIIGTFPGYAYLEQKEKSAASLIASLVMLGTRTNPPKIHPVSKIRTDLLTGKNKEFWLIIQNNEQRTVSAAISIPAPVPAKHFYRKELFAGKPISVNVKESSLKFRVTLKPGAVEVYKFNEGNVKMEGK